MSQQLRRDIRAEELQFLVEYTTKKLQREAQAVEELARHVLDVWQACIDSVCLSISVSSAWVMQRERERERPEREREREREKKAEGGMLEG